MDGEGGYTERLASPSIKLQLVRPRALNPFHVPLALPASSTTLCLDEELN
jgi:hypothetical protein